MAYKNLLLILALAVIYVQAASVKTEIQNADIKQIIEDGMKLVQRINKVDIEHVMEHATQQVQRMTNAPIIKNLSKAIGLRFCPFAMMSGMMNAGMCIARKLYSSMGCAFGTMLKMFMCMASHGLGMMTSMFGGGASGLLGGLMHMFGGGTGSTEGGGLGGDLGGGLRGLGNGMTIGI